MINRSITSVNFRHSDNFLSETKLSSCNIQNQNPCARLSFGKPLQFNPYSLNYFFKSIERIAVKRYNLLVSIKQNLLMLIGE